MWPFGRRRDAIDLTRCAECGRTLLAGEWTQRVVDDDGRESLICSLCSQYFASEARASTGQVARAEYDPPAATTERGPERRSDALVLALKGKDAEIADLRVRLARSEAERDELAGELARTRDEEAASTAAATVATFRGETGPMPRAMVVALESDTVAEGVEEQPGPTAVTEAGERTEDWPAPTADDAEPDVELGEANELEDTLAGSLPGVDTVDKAAAAGGSADDQLLGRVEDEDSGGYPAEEELHLLQRGVDLVNVSQVPKKIAETSASLGVPFVHVAFGPDANVSVTFMWPLGWYRYAIALEGAGRVTLAERGYEDLPDVQPNCTVRGDGTVQLAPAFGRRPTPKEETAADTEPSVTTASVTSGVIISKSLLGQRTDDETVVPWEGQNPRDFDWGR
jgi:hypothetical protein